MAGQNQPFQRKGFGQTDVMSLGELGSVAKSVGLGLAEPFVLSRDVFEGKVDPFSPEGLERTHGLAVDLATGGLGAAKAGLSGDLGILGGALGKGASKGQKATEATGKAAKSPFSKLAATNTKTTRDGSVMTMQSKIGDADELEVVFENADLDGGIKGGNLLVDFFVNGKIGTGDFATNPNAKRILATVFENIREVVDKAKPGSLAFTGADPRLDSFYAKIAPRLAREVGGEHMVGMNGHRILFGEQANRLRQSRQQHQRRVIPDRPEPSALPSDPAEITRTADVIAGAAGSRLARTGGRSSTPEGRREVQRIFNRLAEQFPPDPGMTREVVNDLFVRARRIVDGDTLEQVGINDVPLAPPVRNRTR